MASSSSSIITSINSALDDLGFLLLIVPDFKQEMYRLRNLKTFVLCARRSNDNKNVDASLGSLLIRIESVLRRYAQKLHSSRLKYEDEATNWDVYVEAGYGFCYETDVQPSEDEIDEWYITMSDNTPQSSSLTADEIVEITASVSENLLDFPSLWFSDFMKPWTESLREHLEFLTNFFRFVIKSGAERGQIEALLTHTETVAINAAHICFLSGAYKYCCDETEEWRKKVRFKISILVQKIKPIDRQVYETYNQALCCSKCPPIHDSTIVMKDFVDSLIHILWDILQQDTCCVTSWKDDRQVLYEGLRSLRTILKKLPNNIDEKTWDVTRDAGVLICSFYQKNVKLDLGLEDLLERMKPFLAEAEEKVPQTLIFNPPRINELDFVNFLLENLMELTHVRVEPVVKSRVQTIKEELLHLKSFLEETVKSGALWNRILEVLYQLEFLIDHLVAGDISDSFSMQFDSVMEDLQNIKADDALNNFDGKREDIKVKKVSRTRSHVPSPKTDSLTTEVVGFIDEAKSIMERLTRGSKQLQVIAIVGMGGCGKTTLATKVFNDPSVMHHFDVRAWRRISQTLDKKALLLELLNQIRPEKYSKTATDDLAEKLRHGLKGRMYLLFLDDIWTIDAWNGLKGSFPDDSTGSRIILTSRNCGAAPLDMLDQEPHFLRPLTQVESLELLQRKLFPRDDNWPPAFYDRRMQIVEKCQGLPLAIVVVSGLLSVTEQESWKEIVDGLSSEVVSSSLELSYQHLPDYLKSCLLYFGTFPEDQEVSVRRLIRLWIAEGFVQKSESKSLEDVAEDYMMDLIGRSLIMVVKQRSIGGVKSCHIHDVLHDFCLKKAKEEYFFHLLKGQDELLDFNEPSNFRRLCIHSKPMHFMESKLFCPRARSLRFFFQEEKRYETCEISFVFHIFKLVKVLDFKGFDLFDWFPSEIKFLVQLRYLSIQGYINAIPSSIGNLSMLETLIVHTGDDTGFTLPDTFWNLRKLKYVSVEGYASGISIPIKNLDNNSVLYELDRISTVFFICNGSMEKLMGMFPNIRKLKCKLWRNWDDDEEVQNIVVPKFLSRLESLDMTWDLMLPRNFEIDFPTNLKKLTLGRFRLPWSKISTIGKLPNLEVLKLLHSSCIGETWEMEEGEFPKLRYLKLSELGIVRWTASDDQFPCLEKLVLEWCESLEEMPCYCLGSTTPTLEMIEVSYCSKATRSLVKQIKDQQASFGNSALKVIIKQFKQ